MDLFITPVPLWVSVSFSILFLTVPTLLIANAAMRALQSAQDPNAVKTRNSILIFYLIYFTVIAGISLTGFFATNTLPPKIVVTAALPLLIFYLLVVQRTKWFKTIMETIQLEQLVFIHVFRFVGTYFLIVSYYGALPSHFALIGGLGDILAAVLTFPVIYFLRKKASFAITFTWVWNFIGLLDILSVLTTATLISKAAMLSSEQGVAQFGTFPFSWIPAFAPATIIFLHILTFKKLIKMKK